MSKPHWSFSSYDEFTQCGHRYFLKRVKQAPTLPSVAAVAGRAFHRWTEVHDSAFINYAGFILPTEGDWEVCLFEEIEREEEHSGVARGDWRVSGRESKDKPNKEDLDWWLTAGWELCQRYADWRSKVNTRIATDLPPDENGNTLGIEYALNVELVGLEFYAHLDRVEYDENGNLGVRDLKTGRLWVSVQPGFYAGAARMHGIRLHWWDKYDARKGITVPNPPKPLDNWDATRVSHLLAQAEDQRSRHIYPVRVGEHCNYCPVRDACNYKM